MNKMLGVVIACALAAGLPAVAGADQVPPQDRHDDDRRHDDPPRPGQLAPARHDEARHDNRRDDRPGDHRDDHRRDDRPDDKRYGRWDPKWGPRPGNPPAHRARHDDWYRHVRACQQRYRSYDARTDTFVHRGRRLRCSL
ncbi:BA14K family protein [Xanthomonas sp. CFBP 8703]|uniref:Lectin-like protein BA14k n=1 Tax=Xanthomonas bonasiae TaxID=2810351 RepID=A0ABS3AZZ6_9XANT|nr:BA14K family protein [Xanthomonas bonasiae]MBN6101907.1 BA14K family protein [Xanthomonas bonasiae]MBN6110930.1 BA14K family protein [Xanthomonas bonasiae]